MLDKDGNIIYSENQYAWRNQRNCARCNPPVCEICGLIIYSGEVVVQQGGPHVYCYGKDPMVAMLKILERKNKG
jgi:hypothetical protein